VICLKRRSPYIDISGGWAHIKLMKGKILDFRDGWGNAHLFPRKL
jgi:hypothetical protein